MGKPMPKAAQVLTSRVTRETGRPETAKMYTLAVAGSYTPGQIKARIGG
jgi:hypothetical protein